MSLQSSQPGEPFRRCGACGQQWPQWNDFVLDPALRLLGFQVVTDFPDANLLVFEHRCGSSVSVLASRLRHLLPHPDTGAGLPRLFGTDTCGGHCRDRADLESCDRACINARDRQLILELMRMKDAGAGESGPKRDN